jgi:esterase/lipase
MTDFPVESILSARQVVSPQIAGDYVYFVSDMSGMMSLYRMKKHGSFPERLLPAGMAIQNPHLMAGHLYIVFPKLKRILLMLDEDGNELYQPCLLPLEGGVPKPIFGSRYSGQQITCHEYDAKKNIAYFNRDDRTVKDEAIQYASKVDLETLTETALGTSERGLIPQPNGNHSKVLLSEGYIAGDVVTYLWEEGSDVLKTVLGTPITEREADEDIKKYHVFPVHWLEEGVLVYTTEFDDLGGLGFMELSNPENFHEVSIEGLVHEGIGEFESLEHIDADRHMLGYNIDGSSWKYEATFDSDTMQMKIRNVLVGKEPFKNGVDRGVAWDKSVGVNERKSIEYALSFTSATQPSQLYLHTPEEDSVVQLSREKVIGIPEEAFSSGEDASYESFDGLRISARLYLPSESLDFEGPRPLVLYVHGGPQSQERPDFTWFSMPLIQLLTMNGFAVFVPNVRGSTGYGMKYMKQVDHDWGGKDRLDHVEGIKMLEKDSRIDSSRRAVVGRSYGGFMTLTLATRHPDLWSAACDMFGPYDLISFVERLPESWAVYFYLSIGHPEKDAEFLKERSPSTYMDQLQAPLLVIQGKNDPRVVEDESKDIVERLREDGKEVEYLVFEDEGHDVLKYKNKVTVYNRIVDFFKTHLQP